jgi:chemotaxis methyl-accepting protein methylase
MLTPDGLLFLGHAESLNAVTDRVTTVVPTVYAPAPPRPAGAAARTA